MPKASNASAAPAATAAHPATSPEPVPASYEAALEELEALVSRLESGQMPLDSLLTSYQRGASLLQFCRDRLNEVEHQVSLLDKGQLSTWKPE